MALTHKSKIDTVYLEGDDYFYHGKELDGLKILDRDVKAREILRREGHEVRPNTHSTARDGYYIITSTTYKQAAYK